MTDETSSIIIPSSPADRKALQDGINEIVNSKIRAHSEAAYQKESIEELSKKFEIPKKYLSKMATDLHKQKFDEESASREEYEELYEIVIKKTGNAIETEKE